MVITAIEILFAGIVVIYFLVMFVLAYADDLQKEEKNVTELVDSKDINNYLKKEPTLNEEKSENTFKTKYEIINDLYVNDWEEIDDFNRKGR